MYLSLESNFTSFVGARGVQQANGDVTSNSLIIIGFQGCNRDLQVQVCLITQLVVPHANLTVEVLQIGPDVLFTSDDVALSRGVVDQLCLTQCMRDPCDAGCLWDIVCWKAAGANESIEQGRLACN